MNNELEQIAQQNEMSIEFVTWFFDKKKSACGEHWFLALGAMWEGWKGRGAESTAALATIEKCREITNCPAGADLQDHLRQLAAENLTMIRLLTDISDNHVEYFSEGEGYMFAGVPLDYVSEINMYVSRDVNAENPFPATDRIYAGIKADGVEMFAAEQRGVAERLQKRNVVVAARSISFCLESAEEAEVFAKQLREGADK
ncbi:TPA: hypothetical protein ACT19U_004637 [Raoultella ornithinolytica]